MPFSKLILMLGFLPCVCFSQPTTPARPYNFNAPDISSLVPFSPEQLRAFRENKVKAVFSEESNGVNGIFYFNQLGQLVKERTWYWEKNKKVFTDSTVYKYNNAGQLTLVRSFEGAEAYDSIAYDENGRMVAYLSLEYIKAKNKKKEKILLWDLRLSKKEGENYLLEDRADSANRVMISFDRYNIAWKSWSSNRRDSLVRGISISPPRDGPYLSADKSFYRENGSDKYLLGKEKIFTGALMTAEIQYDMNQPGLISKRSDYIYSMEGRLLQVNDSYSSQLKTIFIYDSKGLPTEEVSVMPDQVEITFFTYQYY